MASFAVFSLSSSAFSTSRTRRVRAFDGVGSCRFAQAHCSSLSCRRTAFSVFRSRMRRAVAQTTKGDVRVTTTRAQVVAAGGRDGLPLPRAARRASTALGKTAGAQAPTWATRRSSARTRGAEHLRVGASAEKEGFAPASQYRLAVTSAGSEYRARPPGPEERQEPKGPSTEGTLGLQFACILPSGSCRCFENPREPLDELLVRVEERIAEVLYHPLYGEEPNRGHVREEDHEARLDSSAPPSVLPLAGEGRGGARVGQFVEWADPRQLLGAEANGSRARDLAVHEREAKVIHSRRERVHGLA